MITQTELKEILHYDPDTGFFRWKVSRGGMYPGYVAGWLKKSNKDYFRRWQIEINNKAYEYARLAFLYMEGRWPEEMDHINRCPWDNRWCNLRETSRSENCHNRRTWGKYPKSVTRRPNGRFWARIQVNGVRRSLGVYDTAEEASEVYYAEAKRLGLMV